MTRPVTTPREADAPMELRFDDPSSDHFAALSRDRIPVRSLKPADLDQVVRIDRAAGGLDRRAYFERKFAEALAETGVRVSLVAELEGLTVGFMMARVDYGEFGQVAAAAVIDTLGTDPDWRGRGVAQALLSQLLVNLATLGVERVLTEVDWHDLDLLGFLGHTGFRPADRLVLRKPLT